MTCAICDQMKDALFLSESFAVLLPKKSYAPGHVLVVPRTHYVILEQIPSEEVGHLFTVANKVSSILFDAMQAHGTNLLVRNGIPAGQDIGHVGIDVVPRWKNDTTQLQWQPQQIPEDVFEKFFGRLSNELKDSIVGYKKKEEVYAMDERGQVVRQEPKKEEQHKPAEEPTPEKPVLEKSSSEKKEPTPWQPAQDNRIRHLFRLP
jgi:histidine triad (HIT) family protein